MFAIALIGYGASGILLLAGLALVAVPMTATIEALARSSEDVRSTLVTTENAFTDFGTSLVAARRSAERAADAARGSRFRSARTRPMCARSARRSRR
jgi:hypothetical protein